MTKSVPEKMSVAKRAVNKVKAAPQRLMEHTVDKAIKTVEKAAEKQAVRAEKASVKRVVKAARKAKKATRTATAAKKPVVRRIKEQIKEIITTKDEVFFYSHRKLIYLALAYAFISFIVWVMANGIAICPPLQTPVVQGLMIITMFITLAALASAVFVMIIPPAVAVVTNEFIRIDHNAPLHWKDVRLAEEKTTALHRPFIALHLKEGAVYPLTFMQKLCRNNIFTPFSLPLYAMEPEDADRLRKLVKKHSKYKNNVK